MSLVEGKEIIGRGPTASGITKSGGNQWTGGRNAVLRSANVLKNVGKGFVRYRYFYKSGTRWISFERRQQIRRS